MFEGTGFAQRRTGALLVSGLYYIFFTGSDDRNKYRIGSDLFFIPPAGQVDQRNAPQEFVIAACHMGHGCRH